MYEIRADDNRTPSCTASTRRLAKRRSSRNRTTWNSMSLAVSPPLTKCTDSALGGRPSRTSVRLLATNDCAMSWPPKVRIGFLLGWDPVNRSSEMRFRSSTASSSSKSLPAGTGPRSPCRLDVVLPDPVHMDQVGRPYCARWRARDDDHQVAALVATELEQRLVDL